jgi:four helix bundle protein
MKDKIDHRHAFEAKFLISTTYKKLILIGTHEISIFEELIRKEIMEMDNLIIYKQSMSIAQRIWDIVLGWDSFAKYTLGKQWINASDSISQNISEGLGRYHYRDAKNFFYYSRGSLFESITILTKAQKRKLISESEFSELYAEPKDLTVRLNNFIQTVGTKRNFDHHN